MNTVINTAIIALVMVLVLVFSARNVRRFSIGDWFIAGLPFFVLVVRLLAAEERTGQLAAVAFNLFLLALGVIQVWAGLRSQGLMDLNFGLAVLSALIAVHFFDTHLTFLMRGMLFMALGSVFIAGNAWLVIRRKRPGGAV